MLRISIFWKLFGAFGLLILATMTTVWLVVSPRVEAHTVREISDDLEVRAALVLNFLPDGTFREPPPAGVDARIDRFGAASGTRFTVIRDDGLVVADSERDPNDMEPHGEREEALASDRPADPPEPKTGQSAPRVGQSKTGQSASRPKQAADGAAAKKDPSKEK